MSSSSRLGAAQSVEGTRVVLLDQRASSPNGLIHGIRQEPWLKRYVVKCDDGSIVYASPHQLALESDASRAPLGVAPEY